VDHVAWTSVTLPVGQWLLALEQDDSKSQQMPMCESANSSHLQKALSSIPGERIPVPFRDFLAVAVQGSLPLFSADFHLRAGG
jgi:hypothetical protein